MWHVTAREQLACDSCEHIILPGQDCISDLPESLPKGVTRQNYRHFHTGCPECKTDDGLQVSCYQTLASHLVTEQAPSETVCMDCGHLIHRKEEFLWDFFYLREDGRKEHLSSERGPAALLSALSKGQKVNPSRLDQMSQAAVRKFSRAGLGNGRGSRNMVETSNFYRRSIPGPVRNLGEGAVNRFTKGKEASHIRSVANSPGQAHNPANVIWESSRANGSRGARNMTRMEILGAKAVNATDTAKILGQATARNAGKGAAWTALFELPVSLAENGINVYRGKKTREEAVKDTGRDVALAGAAGGALGAGTTAAIALGAGPAIAAAGPVLVPVGVAIFALSTGYRLRKAWKDDLTMIELHFHANCSECDSDASCYQDFAEWVSLYSMEGIDTAE